MEDKKAQFDFVWLFAIIAGAAILTLAIYGATKFSDTTRFETDSKIAKEIVIITDSMQAGVAEGKTSSISLNQRTRINNICFEENFGRNSISVSTKSGIGEEWNRNGVPISVKNKYIFSEKIIEGKKFIVFSKPFEFPYEVSDLTVIIPKEKYYCFSGFEGILLENIQSLNLPNAQIENCTIELATKICYGPGIDCDIRVNGDHISGSVIKSEENIKYAGNLLYAAIFSDKEIYDCNVKRILYRTGKVAEELSIKVDLMNARGCSSNMKSDLLIWQHLTTNATSDELKTLSNQAKNLESKNNGELCGVWDWKD